MALQLKLDHASIAVPDMDLAVDMLAGVAGLQVTRSPADPRRHGRIYLDRSYLEVAADPSLDRWQCLLFFLRFDDPAMLDDHLAAAGIENRIGTYQGVDGTWDDVEVSLGDVPLPILVRRTHPPDIAADWPPAIKTPHPGGARTLAQVHVAVSDLAAAEEAYARLLGIPCVRQVDSRGSPLRVFPAPPGRIVLSSGPAPGITAIVIGIHATPPADAPPEGASVEDIAWLDLPVVAAVRLGLAGTSRHA